MKFATAALLAFGVAANDRIEVFHPSNYKNLMSTLIDGLVHKKFQKTDLGATGIVTWAQCSDDVGVFVFDESATSTDPSPVVKGSDVKLNLGGQVSDTMIVTNIHVHVLWNGSNLYDQDLKQNNTYDSTYKYTVGWNVPSYAPSGHYDVTMTGTGSSEGTDGTVLCVNAQFDL